MVQKWMPNLTVQVKPKPVEFAVVLERLSDHDPECLISV